MALDFEFFTADGVTVAAGVFLPVAALPGLLAAELAAGNARESKVVLALMNQMYEVLGSSSFAKLGFALTKGNPTGVGPDLLTQSYGVTLSYIANHADNTLSQIPSASTGTNANLGEFAVDDVFTGAAKLAAGANTGGAGVLVVTSELQSYGGPAQADIGVVAGSDDREWFAALTAYTVMQSTVRSANDASAITARSRGQATGGQIPAAYYAATNPTAGLSADDLDRLSLFTVAFSVTVQLLIDQEAQTFDVNAVVA